MSLTLRNVKGSPLTYTEMDDNLTYLEGLAGATGGTGILDDLIVTGTSSLGDVVINDDKIIKPFNGNSKLDLRPNSTDNTAELSTQNAGLKSALELDPGNNNNGTRLYVASSLVPKISGIEIKETGIDISSNYIDGVSGGVIDIDGTNNSIFMYAYGNVDIQTDDGVLSLKGNVSIDTFLFYMTGLVTHADNASAISGGLTVNQVYKTSTGELRIVV